MPQRIWIARCLALLCPDALSAVEVHGGQRQAVEVGKHQGFVLEPPQPGKVELIVLPGLGHEAVTKFFEEMDSSSSLRVAA